MTDDAKRDGADDLWLDDELHDEALDRAGSRFCPVCVVTKGPRRAEGS